MAWRHLTHSAQAKLDYALGSAGITAPAWVAMFDKVYVSDITDLFVMLSAIGGFALICLRVLRAWKRRHNLDD